MRAKFTYLIALMILILATAVVAKPVDVYHDEVYTDVFPGEVAKFKLYITNNQAFEDTFNIILEDLRFVPTLQPITHLTGGIKVAPGETVESDLYLVPSDLLRIGEYSISLEAISRTTKDRHRDIITVYLAPEPVDIEIAPDITASISMPQQIDPRDDLYIDVEVINNNALELEDLTLEARSSIFSKEQKMSIGPNGSEKQRFKIELDSTLPPRSDLVTVSISRDNRFLDLVQQDVEIIAYTPPFDKSFTDDSGFLWKSKEIVLKNKGNVENTETIKDKMSFVRRWFTETNPSYTLGENKELMFSVTLGPQEATSVRITTSYRPLLVFILIFLAVLSVYYLSRSPIIVTKSASVVRRREGGISRVKVRIHVKNRTHHVFDNVRIVDKVQKIAKVLKEREHVGTVKPHRVARKGGVTLVEWKLPKLDAGEERIITYQIESSLSILGDFRLRKAMVEYHKDKVKGRSLSNEFFIEK